MSRRKIPLSERDGPLTASVRFTGKTQRDREAEEVFRYCLSQPDPDDPQNSEKHMIPQQILVEAMIAYGHEIAERDGIVMTSQDSIAVVIRELVGEFRRGLDTLTNKIDSMAMRGDITKDQAKSLRDEVDNDAIKPDFVKNFKSTLKPGKTNPK